MKETESLESKIKDLQEKYEKEQNRGEDDETADTKKELQRLEHQYQALERRNTELEEEVRNWKEQCAESDTQLQKHVEEKNILERKVEDLGSQLQRKDQKISHDMSRISEIEAKLDAEKKGKEELEESKKKTQEVGIQCTDERSTKNSTEQMRKLEKQLKEARTELERLRSRSSSSSPQKPSSQVEPHSPEQQRRSSASETPLSTQSTLRARSAKEYDVEAGRGEDLEDRFRDEDSVRPHGLTIDGALRSWPLCLSLLRNAPSAARNTFGKDIGGAFTSPAFALFVYVVILHVAFLWCYPAEAE
eukprot:gb/GECG01002542.1/.p1 GENE.gb/GECG01002542.1/~~gb/GECG01002542.1/.p1  ORF type:complete len:304 (+),score=70.33 gb/GECG01002542.1/:1-912(+)